MFAAEKDVTLQSIALEVSHVPQLKNPATEKFILSEDALNTISLGVSVTGPSRYRSVILYPYKRQTGEDV